MSELAVDKTVLLEYLANDTQLLKEVIGIFLAECPGKLAALRAAVIARNSDRIASGSHALRGSLGIFAAETAVDLTQELESMGREEHLEGVDELFSKVAQEISLVCFALEQIAKDTL